MKNLLIKSEENYESFHILKDACKLSSCVHCAYYSVFQLSIYSLCKYFGYKYRYIIGVQGEDSHTFIIDKLASEIENRDYFDSVDYLESINDLKMSRKKADYWRELIDIEEVDTVTENLENNIKLIKNKYV